jgi:3-oxoisoapionate kinase
MTNPLPRDRPIFSFYGDDFTGSTDALEALAENGVPTVLFLRTPDAHDLDRFRDCRAVGIAGDSRSRSPEWMCGALPAVFGRLREIGAPVVQYKVCSTFDSAPETGSIGRAMELGQQAFGSTFVPVVPAAPLLGRYVVFGNLFAGDRGIVHRIDRHPSMMAHPVTPMDEGDLRVHLSRQTAMPIASIDILALRCGADPLVCPTGLLFDGLDPSDLSLAARWIWQHRSSSQTFVIGSSGFTYGMVDFWRAEGWLPEPAAAAPPPPVDRVLVLAGSCSPATERQIRTALRSGFHGIHLDAAALDASAAQNEAVTQLAAGRSVVLYSALGGATRVEGIDREDLASRMGRLLRNAILASGVTRVVVAGGDTSSHAVRELNLTALTYSGPLARGAPLCRAHGWRGDLELVLKGGQVGSDDFFSKVIKWE